MDFFEHQERARRNTARLLLAYALAVGLLCAALYLVIAAATNLAESWAVFRYPFRLGAADWAPRWWRPLLLAQVSLGTVAVLGAAATYKVHLLKSGGISVADRKS